MGDAQGQVSAVAGAPGSLARFLDGDLWHSFRSSPVAVAAAVVALACVLAALFAPWLAPNSLELKDLELSDSMLPPAWMAGAQAKYPLGTDEQGRCVLSALMYGARISLFVGGVAVILSVLIGICDVMLSFPSILVALLIDGVGRAMFPSAHETLAFGVLIFAIALTGWVQYARTVRGSTLVERNKEYVQAARVIGVAPLRIMRRHVLPNVLGPVLVLATIQVAAAILIEATLSFLGVGVPPTSPSLGTFINEGNKQLFSGAWWLVIFPGATLVVIALSINLFGDWLRDALNPRLL
jgi:peptide/nickel transport system permease protein